MVCQESMYTQGVGVFPWAPVPCSIHHSAWSDLPPGTVLPHAFGQSTTPLCAPHVRSKGRPGVVEVLPSELEWLFLLPTPHPATRMLLGALGVGLSWTNWVGSNFSGQRSGQILVSPSKSWYQWLWRWLCGGSTGLASTSVSIATTLQWLRYLPQGRLGPLP